MSQSFGVIVFGATGGVGSALAARLRQSGTPVLLAGRNQDRLTEIATNLDAPRLTCEATDAASIEAVFAKASELWDSIAGVANCIGTVLLKPAHLTTDDEFVETININLFSSFAIVRCAAKAMRKQGGSVVLVSTAAAEQGMANHEAIAAAKAGVIGLARSAAATYANRGIRFNVVAPGLVRTELTRGIWDNETNAAASLDMHALGRFGEPDDVASCIEWLLSPRNSWITGQVIAVDGGLSRVLPRRKG